MIVPETEHGRAWAEARIKAITGGEKMTRCPHCGKLDENLLTRSYCSHCKKDPYFPVVPEAAPAPRAAGKGFRFSGLYTIAEGEPMLISSSNSVASRKS